MQHNPTQIADDFAARGFGEQAGEFGPQVALLGPPEWINIDRGAQIDPFVVIDARKGPVSIEAGTVIQPFTRLEGPCHIGRGSQLFRANVRGGTTLGPQCRIGGEVEASIVHGYSNKYHDGFLGHSYVGAWVNLGAQTTNSDLKHDYSAVSVPLQGTPVDTGLSKVGCFIGDHTKTALGSLFNTGSSIGVMCTILPGGELLPKHVPSFASIWHGELAPGLAFERLLAAARIAMLRRDCELTAAEERLWQHLFHTTRREREDAIDRSRAKRARPELTVRHS